MLSILICKFALLHNAMLLTYDDVFIKGGRHSGPYINLERKLNYAGGSVYYIMQKVGIWCAIIALLCIGLLWVLHKKPKEIEQNKFTTSKTIIAIVLFFAVAGICALVIKAGLDYGS